MPFSKLQSAVACCLAATLTIYLLTDASIFSSLTMTDQQENPPTADHLRIFLSHTWLPIPTVKVTIQNTHSTATMSFLTWDTPVDKSALNTGVLQLTDAVSEEAIQGPGLKLNRLLPPPREDVTELGPQEVVEVDIELTAPWIPSGHKLVKVHAAGLWRAIWTKPNAEVTDEELQDMSGPGVLQGPFRSMRDVELELAEQD